METVEELEAKLAGLLEQYKLVEQALEVEPQNTELLAVQAELKEVITLTEDLYKLRKGESKTNGAASTSTTTKSPTYTSPSALNLTYKPGDTCEAQWSGDKTWYPAVIDSITEDGNYHVTFTGYGNSEVVRPECVRDRPPEPPKPAGKTEKKTKNKGKINIYFIFLMLTINGTFYISQTKSQYRYQKRFRFYRPIPRKYAPRRNES